MAHKYVNQWNGWLTNGILHIVDGRLYLCDWPVEKLVKQFEGQHVELGVCPVEDDYTIDPGIEPLVKTLQKKGLRTLSSCQGHLGDPWLDPYPSVSVALLGDDEFPDLRTSHDWLLEYQGSGVYKFRPRKAATNDVELAILQREALELALAIS